MGFVLDDPRKDEYTFHIAKLDDSGNYSNSTSVIVQHPGFQKPILSDSDVKRLIQEIRIQLPTIYPLQTQNVYPGGNPEVGEVKDILGYKLYAIPAKDDLDEPEVGAETEVVEYEVTEGDNKILFFDGIIGQRYQLQITAYDSVKESEKSDPIFEYCGYTEDSHIDPTPPNTPSNFNIEKSISEVSMSAPSTHNVIMDGDSNVIIEWERNTEPSFSHYKIKYDTNSDLSNIEPKEQRSNQFNATGLTADDVLYFEIISVGVNGIAIKITWDAVTTNTDGDTVENIANYAIQYKETSQTEWKEVSVEHPETKTLIGGLEVDKTYDIRMRTINALGRKSGWTSIKAVTIDEASKISDSEPYTFNVSMPQLLNSTVADNYTAETEFQTLLDNNFYGSVSGDINATQIRESTLELSSFASGIRPVQLVDILPSLPNSDFPDGSVIRNAADGKLYRNNNDSWTSEVPTEDLTGEIVEGQISNEAVTRAKIALNAVDTAQLKLNSVQSDIIDASSITSEKIANGEIILSKFGSGLRPVQIVSSLPSLPNSDYPPGSAVVLNNTSNDNHGKLYRNKSDSWTAEVPTNDLTGQITETQITDDSISTPKLQANSITTAKINAGAVDTNQLNAGSITTAKISAGAVTATEVATNTLTATQIAASTITAGEIATDTITANEISANTITASEIFSATITTNEIASRTVLAENIASGAITANEISANTITANEIAGNTITANQILGNTITAGEIATGAIKADEIDADAVTADKIGADEVQAVHILSDSIQTRHIQAGAVETEAIAVGSLLRNFDLQGVSFTPNLNGNRTSISWSSGYLTRITGPNESVRSSWTINSNSNTSLIAGNSYYVYAKAHHDNDDLTIEFDTTDRSFDDGTYYHYKLGVYDTSQNPAVLATSYGFTYIDGNKITTGTINANDVTVSALSGDVTIDGEGINVTNGDISISGGNIQSANGNSVIDLSNENFNFGTKLSWDGNTLDIEGSITISSGSGISNLSDSGSLATQDTADYTNDVSGTKPPEDADATVTTINGGIITTGTIELEGGGGNTKAGITAIGTGDDSVRIWAGDTYTARGSAPFRVTQGGNVDIHGDLLVSHVSDDLSASLEFGYVERQDGTSEYGFRLDTPNLQIYPDGNAVFGGELQAASGTFEGELTAVSGTFEGELTAVSSQIKISETTYGGRLQTFDDVDNPLVDITNSEYAYQPFHSSPTDTTITGKLEIYADDQPHPMSMIGIGDNSMGIHGGKIQLRDDSDVIRFNVNAADVARLSINDEAGNKDFGIQVGGGGVYVTMVGLPTSEPSSPNLLWNDRSNIRISTGSSEPQVMNDSTYDLGANSTVSIGLNEFKDSFEKIIYDVYSDVPVYKCKSNTSGAIDAYIKIIISDGTMFRQLILKNNDDVNHLIHYKVWSI